MNLELLTHLVTIAASLGVGLPILYKAWRSDDRTAALLAASLVVDGVEWTLWALYLYGPTENPAVSDAFAVACRIGISAAVLCLGLFTQRTFRRQSAGARLFLWACAAAMAAGFFGSGAVGDWCGFRSDHPWTWIEIISQIAVYAWACLESILFWRTLRRRLAHGLADPVLANKFALWAVYAGGYCLTQIMFLLATASPGGFTELDSISIYATFAGIAALWLAFFPPQPYQTWLRRSTASA